MTVRELREYLERLPYQDADVIYSMFSEYTELLAEDIRIYKAEEHKLKWRPANGYSSFWPSADKAEDIEFRTVVVFPGN